MKKHHLLIFLFATLLASCGGSPINTPLVYEKNPQYSWGYVEYFGDYYFAENKNTNNVLSVSLFTDSLKLNDLGNLTGLGQYLYLEDVFQAPTNIFLQPGTYTVNDTGLPFSIAPGKNDTIDTQVYPIGAYISYYEYNASNSTLKLIKSGTMTVGLTGTKYTIACNFKTSDGMDLTGNYSATLPHIDQSITIPASGTRKRPVYSGK